jgi:hypothetical protein
MPTKLTAAYIIRSIEILGGRHAGIVANCRELLNGQEILDVAIADITRSIMPLKPPNAQ